MEKQINEATITIQGTHANVEFKGLWTKRLVDIAYNRMMHALPGHLAEVRKSETKPKKEKSK